MTISIQRFTRIVVAPALLFTTQCAGGRSSAPTAPSSPVPPPIVSLTNVQVGVAANGSAVLVPGQTLQFWAVANYSDGTGADVTNLATWQSTNPAIATVSPTGLLRAASEGALDVRATYQSKSGALHTEIRQLGCEASTLSPGKLTVGAFGSTDAITVTTPLSDCRWTARSDADWLPFSYEPGRSGNGSFSFSVPANSTPDSRSARIIVSFRSGGELVHTVTQERPASCSYVASPQDTYFTATGGTGFFDVITTPAGCRWNATTTYSFYGIQITGGSSGTGAGRVTFNVGSNPTTSERNATIEVAGLSNVNPHGFHRIHIARQ